MKIPINKIKIPQDGETIKETLGNIARINQKTMTNEDKIRHIFRKHPEARFDRSLAYWLIGQEYYGFMFYALRAQLMAFFKDFSGIERSLRDVLKEEEFKLPPEQDAKRYEKKAEFRAKYKPEDIETLQEEAERIKSETADEVAQQDAEEIAKEQEERNEEIENRGHKWGEPMSEEQVKETEV